MYGMKMWMFSLIGALGFTITSGIAPVNAATQDQSRTVVTLQAETSAGKYQIVDTDGTTYTYKNKKEYESAEKRFKEKWSVESQNNKVGALASDYATESYQHAYFGGWKYVTPVGYYTNFNTSSYNDAVSSIKTARVSAGTRVCYHQSGGEPCKTYGPGLDINYVGDGWNDQISYINVYR